MIIAFYEEILEKITKYLNPELTDKTDTQKLIIRQTKTTIKDKNGE